MKKALRQHHDAVRRMGCIVTGRTDRVTLHHCHSGSMVARGVTRGMSQKVSDWLVIPLDLYLHSMGPDAIDGACGVETWERRFGRQCDWLDRVMAITGVDVWAQARAGTTKPSLPRRASA